MGKHRKYTFGELEQAIMDVVWSRSSVSVRDVVTLLAQRRVAYTTVMTVMTRLTAQGILQRQPGHTGAFVYRAKQSKQAFETAAAQAAIDDVLRRYGAVAVAQFIDRLDHVPADKLEALRKKISLSRRHD